MTTKNRTLRVTVADEDGTLLDSFDADVADDELLPRLARTAVLDVAESIRMGVA